MSKNKSDINRSVPHFTAIDIFGNDIDLSKYKDDYILLTFLRYSGCPFCNLAIHRMTIEHDRLKKEGCQVIAFIQSDKDDVIKNIYGRHDPKPQFPIIADHEMKFYKQFDVEISVSKFVREITKLPYWLESFVKLGYPQKRIDGNNFLVPAWFLINNKTGNIVKSERGVSFYDHETFTSIYESLTFKD